ncbi:WD40 repeat domain-containing serine/threonine protein kinase [Streptomyces sp. NPDC086080]|uniref:WD40 repeat domain-containing serine/threonine protein kinase n=1 Tax=Streptomyces sp. NPDC086080 TaxID=3365748 RepID=UPI0037D943FB
MACNLPRQADIWWYGKLPDYQTSVRGGCQGMSLTGGTVVGADSQGARRLVAGRYRLVEALGRGGMGVVWRATDELIGRPVAVKELRVPQGLSERERGVFSERALREARTAGRLNHPGVVGIHDLVPAVPEDDAVYIVMELVQAPTLAEVLNGDGPLAEERVVGIAAQLLSALRAAHSIGLIHRDVKPSNVMLLPGDEVKLVDFGISHALDDTRLTTYGVAGSTGYMAPELFEDSDPTPAADLWSLGATLFHAVRGSAPFERGSTAATIRAILQDEIPRLDGHPSLAPVVAGLLTRDLRHRLSAQRAEDLLRSAEDPQRGQVNRPRAVDDETTVTRGRARADAASASGSGGWEDEPTTVRAGAPRVRRTGTGGRWGSGTPRSFTIYVPPSVMAFNLAAIAVLALLGGLIAWRFLGGHVAMPKSFQLSGLAVLLVFFLLVFFKVIDSVHYPWWRKAEFASQGLILSASGEAARKCTVAWGDVEAVELEPFVRVRRRGASTDCTSMTLHMSSATPAAVKKKPPFEGFVPSQKGRSFTWTLDYVEAPVAATKAALRAAAPPGLSISSTGEASTGPARFHGPRRERLAAWTIVLVVVLTGTLFFPRHLNPVALGESNWGRAFDLSPNGALLAADTHDGRIKIWDVDRRKVMATLTGHDGGVEALSFSPDNHTLASSGDDSKIKLWKMGSYENTATLTVDKNDPDASATYLRFSPDGTALASVIDRNDVTLWNVPTKKITATVTGTAGGVEAVGFSADGTTLTTRIRLGTTPKLAVWDAGTGRASKGGDGTWALERPNNTVEIWDVGSRKLLHTLYGHSAAVSDTSFAGPDRDLLATSGLDGTIRIWHTDTDTDTGQAAAKVTLDRDNGLYAEKIALSSDGRTLVYGRVGKLWVWQTGVEP